MNTTKGAANAVSSTGAEGHQPPPRSSYDFANYRGQENRPLQSVEDLDLKMKYRVLAILDDILALRQPGLQACPADAEKFFNVVFNDDWNSHKPAPLPTMKHPKVCSSAVQGPVGKWNRDLPPCDGDESDTIPPWRQVNHTAYLQASLHPVLPHITFETVDAKGQRAPAEYIDWDHGSELSMKTAMRALIISHKRAAATVETWNWTVAVYRARRLLYYGTDGNPHHKSAMQSSDLDPDTTNAQARRKQHAGLGYEYLNYPRNAMEALESMEELVSSTMDFFHVG